MDVQVSLEAGAGCDHSKLRNYFSNAAISKNQPIENRKLGRAEYILLSGNVKLPLLFQNALWIYRIDNKNASRVDDNYNLVLKPF